MVNLNMNICIDYLYTWLYAPRRVWTGTSNWVQLLRIDNDQLRALTPSHLNCQIQRNRRIPVAPGTRALVFPFNVTSYKLPSSAQGKQTVREVSEAFVATIDFSQPWKAVLHCGSIHLIRISMNDNLLIPDVWNDCIRVRTPACKQIRRCVRIVHNFCWSSLNLSTLQWPGCFPFSVRVSG